MAAPSLLADAGFVVDFVLHPVLDEDLDHEDDERSLDDHVVAQRKAEEAEIVQRSRVPWNDEGKDEPDDQHRYGEVAGPGPMTRFGVFADFRHVIPSGNLL